MQEPGSGRSASPTFRGTLRALADHPMVGRLGPNALDLSLEEFRGLLKGRRGAIKTFLLDQDRIAGIGNVYVQTPLWRAKIHPLRPIPTLTDDEVAALWQTLYEVLQGSIDAGGAPSELNLYGQKGGWDDPYLFHWEQGAPCPVCGMPLAKIRTGSTGSYICPGCQALEPKRHAGSESQPVRTEPAGPNLNARNQKWVF